jgi:hypothetical protein
VAILAAERLTMLDGTIAYTTMTGADRHPLRILLSSLLELW